MKPTDLDRSLDRVWRSEEHRTRTTGFGTTRQGQALARQYRKQLADSIAADCKKDVCRALKGIDDDTLAIRLLVAGISVAGATDLGVDKHGEKNLNRYNACS
jgi:hypothetical protein